MQYNVYALIVLRKILNCKAFGWALFICKVNFKVASLYCIPVAKIK